MSNEEAIYSALALVLLLFFLALKFKPFNALFGKSRIITDYPIVGMLPGIIWNAHRLHHFLTDLVEESGGTFLFKGGWFTSMCMIVTADPDNVNYILSKNFVNFGKGPEFKKIFEDLGEGIFAAEGESWENQRKAAKFFMANVRFQQFVAETTWEKVDSGLVNVLESSVKTGEKIDLQEIFSRLAFDCTVLMALGHDPKTLSLEMRDSPVVRAFHDAEEATMLRHVVPETVWKLQKFLNIGAEKKMKKAVEIIYGFLDKSIELKEEKLSIPHRIGEDEDHDMFTCYKRAISQNHEAVKISEQVWRDATLNFLFAGKDTISTALSWFFWLLDQNPEKEILIRQEIASNSPTGKWTFSGIDNLKNLIYLHASLCEALRLFPPIALNHKAPVKSDTLPSGHHAKANTKILTSFFSMGRMESIWGKDCREFKPERWISDTGMIVNVPSFKFPAFNAGPRSCIGKDMSFIQMKIAAASVISRFKIKVASDECSILPSCSVVLFMKNGMKANIYGYG